MKIEDLMGSVCPGCGRDVVKYEEKGMTVNIKGIWIPEIEEFALHPFFICNCGIYFPAPGDLGEPHPLF